MKAKYYIGILSVVVLSGISVKAHSSDNDYPGNGGDRIIINNYYDDYDYFYSSRINRFHRSYAVFDYYSPLFTDTYWYTYDPVYWGISIYRGGIGFNFGFNFYHPVYYGYNYYYDYGWYDPYYSYYDYWDYSPYYYSSFCWGYRPFFYNYWYSPVIFNIGYHHSLGHHYWDWDRHNYYGWNDYRYGYHSDYNNRYYERRPTDYSNRDNNIRNESRRQTTDIGNRQNTMTAESRRQAANFSTRQSAMNSDSRRQVANVNTRQNTINNESRRQATSVNTRQSTLNNESRRQVSSLNSRQSTMSIDSRRSVPERTAASAITNNNRIVRTDITSRPGNGQNYNQSVTRSSNVSRPASRGEAPVYRSQNRSITSTSRPSGRISSRSFEASRSAPAFSGPTNNRSMSSPAHVSSPARREGFTAQSRSFSSGSSRSSSSGASASGSNGRRR